MWSFLRGERSTLGGRKPGRRPAARRRLSVQRFVPLRLEWLEQRLNLSHFVAISEVVTGSLQGSYVATFQDPTKQPVNDPLSLSFPPGNITGANGFTGVGSDVNDVAWNFFAYAYAGRAASETAPPYEAGASIDGFFRDCSIIAGDCY